MSTPFEEMASELLARYEEQLEHAASVRRQLTEVAETATASREVVRVTVGAQGELRGLEFPASAYKRLAPAELTEAIMKTYEQARAQAQAAVRDLMAASQAGESSFLSLIGSSAAEGDGPAAAGLRLPSEITEYLRGGVPAPDGQHG
jgi:hypothetical protein